MIGHIRIAGKNYPLYKGTNTLGQNKRSARVNICHESISDLHGMIIIYDKENIHISDFNSSNGIDLNQQKLNPFELYKLKSGDKLKIGSLAGEFHLHEMEQELALCSDRTTFSENVYIKNTQIVSNTPDPPSDHTYVCNNESIHDMETQIEPACPENIHELATQVTCENIHDVATQMMPNNEQIHVMATQIEASKEQEDSNSSIDFLNGYNASIMQESQRMEENNAQNVTVHEEQATNEQQTNGACVKPTENGDSDTTDDELFPKRTEPTRKSVRFEDSDATDDELIVPKCQKRENPRIIVSSSDNSQKTSDDNQRDDEMLGNSIRGVPNKSGRIDSDTSFSSPTKPTIIGESDDETDIENDIEKELTDDSNLIPPTQDISTSHNPTTNKLDDSVFVAATQDVSSLKINNVAPNLVEIEESFLDDATSVSIRLNLGESVLTDDETSAIDDVFLLPTQKIVNSELERLPTELEDDVFMQATQKIVVSEEKLDDFVVPMPAKENVDIYLQSTQKVFENKDGNEEQCDMGCEEIYLQPTQVIQVGDAVSRDKGKEYERNRDVYNEATQALVAGEENTQEIINISARLSEDDVKELVSDRPENPLCSLLDSQREKREELNSQTEEESETVVKNSPKSKRGRKQVLVVRVEKDLVDEGEKRNESGVEVVEEGTSNDQSVQENEEIDKKSKRITENNECKPSVEVVRKSSRNKTNPESSIKEKEPENEATVEQKVRRSGRRRSSKNEPESSATESNEKTVIEERKSKRNQTENSNKTKSNNQNSMENISFEMESKSKTIKKKATELKDEVKVKVTKTNKRSMVGVVESGGGVATRSGRVKATIQSESDAITTRSKRGASVVDAIPPKRSKRLISASPDIEEKPLKNNENVRTLRRKSSEAGDSQVPKKKRGMDEEINLNGSQSSSSSSGTLRSTRRPKPKVVFTMYKNPQLESVIRQMGGKMVDSVDSSTVLVTESVQRTCKLLTAIGQGKPICSPDWVHKSKKAKEFLDPWEHVIVDKEAESKWKFSLKESLSRSKRNKLLDGYTFQLITSNISENEIDILKSAIKACGGKIVIKLPAKVVDKYFVIATKENKSAYTSLMKKNNNVKVIKAEAIFDSVLRQEVQFEKHYLH